MNDSRGGGGTAIYGLYRVCDAVKDMVFNEFTPGIGYINQSVWVYNRLSFFRKLISWLKILSRLGIVVIGFVLARLMMMMMMMMKTVLLTSVVSGKQLL